MKSSKIIYFILGCMLFIHPSCAPVFSDMQSARVVGKGNVEATPSFSRVGFGEDGDSEFFQTHIGIQGGIGISERSEIRGRIEHLFLDDDGGSATVVGFGPKFSLVENRIAGYIPIGTALGSDIDTGNSWELQPTLLFTVPVNPKIDINPSLKYIIQLTEGADNFVAINLGMAFGEYGVFQFRPEFGLLYNPGESGHYQHFSLGLSWFIMKGDQSEN